MLRPMPTREEQTRLWDEHKGLVYAVVLPRARPTRLRAAGLEVEDLLQEGWLGLVRAWRGYEPSREVAFSTYAFRGIKIRVRAALQRLPRLRGKCRRFDPERPHAGTAIPPAELSDARAEEWAALTRWLGLRERQILDWSYRDLLDQREIAARLGISRWRVVELKARALDKLRAYFQVAREGQP